MGTIVSCRSVDSILEVDSEAEADRNPFDELINKKERQLLRDTWAQLSDTKSIFIGIMTELLDLYPELKPVFGVKGVPRVNIIQMPIFGSHVTQMKTFFDQLTHTLGYMDNRIGALALVRKIGKHHAAVAFPTNPDINWLQELTQFTLSRLVPYLTGENKEDTKPNEHKKEVRFYTSPRYSTPLVQSVWYRLGEIIHTEMNAAMRYETKRLSRHTAASIMNPQHDLEMSERRDRMKKWKDHRSANQGSQSCIFEPTLMSVSTSGGDIIETVAESERGNPPNLICM